MNEQQEEDTKNRTPTKLLQSNPTSTMKKDQVLSTIIPLSLALGASPSQAWTAASSSNRLPYQPSSNHPYNNPNDEQSSPSSSNLPQPLQQPPQQFLYVPSPEELDMEYGLVSPLLHPTKPDWATNLADQLDLDGSSCPDDGCSPPATIRLGESVTIRNDEATWEPFYVSIETTEDSLSERLVHEYWTTKTGYGESSSWSGLTTRGVTSGILAPKGGSGLYSDEVSIVVDEDLAMGGLSTLAPLFLVVRTQNDYWSWRIASGNNLRQQQQPYSSLGSLRP